MFEIGTYAWVAVWKNMIYPQSGGRIHKFLIIGTNDIGMKALLVEPPFDLGERIDDQYLGKKCALIHSDKLKYLGLECSICRMQFDHLEAEKDFRCWRCSI